MNSLLQSTLLRRSALDETDYANSLLTQAKELGMISQGDIADLRQRFGHLIVRQCQAFTGGRSASLRRETLDSLGQSALFTLNVFLKSLEPMDALAALQNLPLEQCYVRGRNQVDSMVRTAELLHLSEIRRELPANAQLLSTFTEGIPGFFKLYNPEYGAHEIHITADYPVLFYPQGWLGIEFILKYLDGFIRENRLLRMIGMEKVHRILTRYALLHDTTARDLCDNLLLISLSSVLNDFESVTQFLDHAGCASRSLRDYAVRAEEVYRTDVRRIQGLLFSRA